MIKIGNQKATVESSYVMVSQSGKPYVRVNFLLEEGGDQIGADVWITTDQAVQMARARLKSIGFDIDQRNLSEIEGNPHLLQGATCEVDVQEEVYNNKARLKVVWFGQPKPPTDKRMLDSLTHRLRAAKKRDEPEERIEESGRDAEAPPAVAHLSKSERERLDKEAEGEGIPF